MIAERTPLVIFPAANGITVVCGGAVEDPGLASCAELCNVDGLTFRQTESRSKVRTLRVGWQRLGVGARLRRAACRPVRRLC